MKLLIVYRPNSEHSTLIESFVRDLQHQHEVEDKIEMISVDTREGAAMAAAYDIWEYPAIIAIANDGGTLNMWTGEQLPLMDEVVSYIYQ